MYPHMQLQGVKEFVDAGYITRFDICFLFSKSSGIRQAELSAEDARFQLLLHVSELENAEPFNGWVRLPLSPFQSLASSDM
jgi:hypothetical protein